MLRTNMYVGDVLEGVEKMTHTYQRIHVLWK